MCVRVVLMMALLLGAPTLSFGGKDSAKPQSWSAEKPGIDSKYDSDDSAEARGSERKSSRDVGFLTVLSKPGSATVYVDGVSIGRTPITRHRVASGLRAVGIGLRAFTYFSFPVAIQPMQLKSVRVQLSQGKQIDVNGEYYKGDGLGMNCLLILKADGEYEYSWHG